ncbi:LysE family transporter [Oceanobacter sp. 4_MG-2023]|uniref:LysE family transporter n=2 Tax=Gammaproteobacteria TaxID=1236 RepID=UPI0027323503|nr:LysE family transporter [Oceanobacter sp. 4_MG-2023]MDP2547685.1 LysE family transporter [Oceanobacter sp. 4_MG-2023]
MALDIWLTFFTACWVISFSPGAGAVASMSSGLQYGFRHGYWNVIGLQLALVVQIGVVVAGVGAVLATSAWAFEVIKWFGVGYLVYLGWLQWHATPANLDDEVEHARDTRRESPARLVLKGFLVNMSNPKAIVFILAVLPQFLNTEAALPLQYGVMLITMVAVDLVVMAIYTGLAAKVLRYLQSPRQQRLLNRSFAVMFVGAASLLSTVHRAS